MAKLLSDQVSSREIEIVLRELKRIINKNIPGDVVEFGCYVGTTSVYLAKILANTERKLYLYDSFEGLPDKTSEDNSPLGEQFKTGELSVTKKQLIKNLSAAGVTAYRIKKAWFSDLTIDDVPESVAFAFLDGDYYASVANPLKLLENRLAPGAVIIVDDYTNQALPGAARAVDGWLVEHTATIRVESSLAILYTS